MSSSREQRYVHFTNGCRQLIPLSLFPKPSLTTVQISHTRIVFISFATIKRPSNADVFVRARGKTLEKLRAEVVSHCPPPGALASKDAAASHSKHAAKNDQGWNLT